MKKITKTWIIDENKGENYIGTKRVDASTFAHGTVIPQALHKKFLENLSVELTKGKKQIVRILYKDKVFKSKIDWVNNDEKRRKDDVVRILFNDKNLKTLLSEKLEKSYEYIIKYKIENDKNPSDIPEEFEEYIDFYKGNELDSFILELTPKCEITDDSDEEIEADEINESQYEKVLNVEQEIQYINKYIRSRGFIYEEELIKNLYISLKTKPFVILSGISGTGKSKIVELFAGAVGATFENKRFKLVPVKPDWSDSTDLLGYRNIEGQFIPGIITKMAYEAMKNTDKPYFICLDEMNLARVEYYLSDILALMETRRLNSDGEIVTERLLSKEQFGRDQRAKDKYGDVYIPENLYIIGTVNMDETTFPFSKKVLDRANTIEFNKVDLSYSFEEYDNAYLEEVEGRNYHNDFLKAKYLKLIQCKDDKEIAIKVIDKLININNVLEKYNQHFGYRVRDEITFYMIYAVKDGLLDFEKAFDICIIQKILPKLSGSNNDVLEILIDLYNLLNNTTYNCEGYLDESYIKSMYSIAKESKYMLSNEKIMYMIRRFVRDGFTTFWQ